MSVMSISIFLIKCSNKSSGPSKASTLIVNSDIRFFPLLNALRLFYFLWLFAATWIQCLPFPAFPRSEEHTSELQSRFDLVCRLLLEKKNKYIIYNTALQ